MCACACICMFVYMYMHKWLKHHSNDKVPGLMSHDALLLLLFPYKQARNFIHLATDCIMETWQPSVNWGRNAHLSLCHLTVWGSQLQPNHDSWTILLKVVTCLHGLKYISGAQVFQCWMAMQCFECLLEALLLLCMCLYSCSAGCTCAFHLYDYCFLCCSSTHVISY